MADMQGSFEDYIVKCERKLAKAGIGRIVPPPEWTPRKEGYPEDLDFTIERPIRQHATGAKGLYRALYIEQKPMSLKDDFRTSALAPENCPSTTDPAEMERKYWKNITLLPPLYGADVLGSLFDEDLKVGQSAQELLRVYAVYGYGTECGSVRVDIPVYAAAA